MELESRSTYVGQFRLHYLHAVDLGVLLKREPVALQRLQRLRSQDELFDELKRVFVAKGAALAHFRSCAEERTRLETRSALARERGGKQIWTTLFFERQAPLRFDDDTQWLNLDTGHEGNVRVGDTFKWADDDGQRRDTGIKYDGCTLRITRDGVLSMSFEFSRLGHDPVMDVHRLIGVMGRRGLAEETEVAFHGRLVSVAAGLSAKPEHELSKSGLRLADPTGWLMNELRISGTHHYCMFLESLYALTGSPPCEKGIPDEMTRSSHLLVGVLNRSPWYEVYSRDYISAVFKGDAGYRRDEIYLTDKDSTLVMLNGYFAGNDEPLHDFRCDLTTAIELLVARVAHVDFLLRHLQTDTNIKLALTDPASQTAVDAVRQIKSILQLAHEGTDIYSLIKHGFTRKVLEHVYRERKLGEYLDSIERWVSNVESSVALQSSARLSVINNSLSDLSNQLQVRWAKAAIIVAAALALCALALQAVDLVRHWRAGVS